MATKKTKQKEVTTLDVQIAEFIRNHKKVGAATDDEINDQLVIPFTLDADGIDDLLQRIQDAGISITDKDGNPSERVLKAEPEVRSFAASSPIASQTAARGRRPRFLFIGLIRIQRFSQFITPFS